LKKGLKEAVFYSIYETSNIPINLHNHETPQSTSALSIERGTIQQPNHHSTSPPRYRDLHPNASNPLKATPKPCPPHHITNTRKEKEKKSQYRNTVLPTLKTTKLRKKKSFCPLVQPGEVGGRTRTRTYLYDLGGPGILYIAFALLLRTEHFPLPFDPFICLAAPKYPDMIPWPGGFFQDMLPMSLRGF